MGTCISANWSEYKDHKSDLRQWVTTTSEREMETDDNGLQ